MPIKILRQIRARVAQLLETSATREIDQHIRDHDHKVKAIAIAVALVIEAAAAATVAVLAIARKATVTAVVLALARAVIARKATAAVVLARALVRKATAIAVAQVRVLRVMQIAHDVLTDRLHLHLLVELENPAAIVAHVQVQTAQDRVVNAVKVRVRAAGVTAQDAPRPVALIRATVHAVLDLSLEIVQARKARAEAREPGRVLADPSQETALVRLARLRGVVNEAHTVVAPLVPAALLVVAVPHLVVAVARPVELVRVARSQAVRAALVDLVQEAVALLVAVRLPLADQEVVVERSQVVALFPEVALLAVSLVQPADQEPAVDHSAAVVLVQAVAAVQGNRGLADLHMEESHSLVAPAVAHATAVTIKAASLSRFYSMQRVRFRTIRTSLMDFNALSAA